MALSCSENKGADQLCSYCTADLRLCFHICKSLVFFHAKAQMTITLNFKFLNFFF